MKPRHTGVWLYVPETFDPSLFPELAGLENEARWLVHKIISLCAYYKHGEQDWCNISRQTMRDFIQPKDVATILSVLKGTVIECDGKYVRGVKSLGYRLTEPYRTDIKRVEVTKRSLAAKVLWHRLKYKNEPISEADMAATEQHLLAWLRKARIDTQRAYQIIDDRSILQGDERVSVRPVKKLGRRGRQKAVNDYTRAINRMTVDQLANGDLDFTVCEFGHRVHTPITRLVTEARSCLSFVGHEDQPLVSIDIRNSQLVFLSMLLLDHQYGRVASSGQDSSGHDLGSSTLSSSFVFIPLRGEGDAGVLDGGVGGEAAGEEGTTGYDSERGQRMTGDLLEPDQRKFVTLCETGMIYDYLMETLNYREDRKKFKQQFFQDMLYCDPQAPYVRQSKLAKLFLAEFPTVYRFIMDQKKGDWTNLCRQMQRRESRFMFGAVVDRLRKYHSDIPVLTIHDSILTTQQHGQTVVRVMTEEFARLGVKAAVSFDGTEVKKLAA